MTSDEVAVYVHLQTVQDYLSEREKAFLVLVDGLGEEITLPSRMPLSCFRLAQADAVCADCYRRCLEAEREEGAAEWRWDCPHGMGHIVIRTAFWRGESQLFLIAGRCADKHITELARVVAAFYQLPLRFDRGADENSESAGKQPESGLRGNAYFLTPQELAVLGHMARGLGNKDIAEALFVSVNTIKSHITHILAKMGAKNRTEASLIAVNEGIATRP
ncbi:MAG: response regulator transcription factor [Gracilibacteraceae bacterium]|jgi:DNA-binding CsgD family transcriptional regulator|nr:response regulator transcription factor [Gracilibacteraceae bacterium]